MIEMHNVYPLNYYLLIHWFFLQDLELAKEMAEEDDDGY